VEECCRKHASSCAGAGHKALTPPPAVLPACAWSCGASLNCSPSFVCRIFQCVGTTTIPNAALTA
jgi:hypothetical protein